MDERGGGQRTSEGERYSKVSYPVLVLVAALSLDMCCTGWFLPLAAKDLAFSCVHRRAERDNHCIILGPTCSSLLLHERNV